MDCVQKACAGQWIAVLHRPLLYAMGCWLACGRLFFKPILTQAA